VTDYRPYHGSSEWVTLTDEEIDYAQRVGLEMRKLSLRNKHRDYRAEMNKEFSEKQAQKNQALGEVADLASRKFFGFSMKLVTENYKKADLPHNIEVRLIGEDRYGLRVYKKDDASRRVVGVVIPPGKERGPYRIAGWIIAADAIQDCWEMAPYGGRPMYPVPQEHLRPMSELKSLTRGPIECDENMPAQYVLL
jgi:hypothetical protein|tara:strand:+ start:2310 stop:2891 length:582 start_codon:yes stop_codon:yes gene_type:complete